MKREQRTFTIVWIVEGKPADLDSTEQTLEAMLDNGAIQDMAREYADGVVRSRSATITASATTDEERAEHMLDDDDYWDDVADDGPEETPEVQGKPSQEA